MSHSTPFTTSLVRLVAGLGVSALALLAFPSAGASQEEGANPEPEVSAEVRARSAVRTLDGDRDRDASSWLRSRIGVDLTREGVDRIYVQVQDARRFGEETSTMDPAADGLDLHQAYLELADEWSDLEARARVGRQEVRWGGERLVGAVGWSNAGRSFDAARAFLTSGSGHWSLEGLAAVVADRDASGSDTSDRLLSGLRVTAGPASLSILREDGYRDVGRTLDLARYTAHAALDEELSGGFSARAEAAYQWGDRAGGSLAAGMAGVRLRHRSPRAAVPLVSAGADWLSGDGVVGDGRVTSFSTLFATNHKFYGYQDFFLDVPAATGRRGLLDLRARVDVDVHPDASLRIEPHAFLASEETVSGARALGRELDVTLPVTLSEDASVQVGYSAFWPDAAARDVGLLPDDDVHHWAYVQSTLSL